MKTLVNKIITGATLLAIAMSSPSREKSTVDGMGYIPNNTYKGSFEEFFVPSYLEPLNDYVAVETKKSKFEFKPLNFTPLKNSLIDEKITRYSMNIESSGDPNAVSPKGAGGLMQLMPPTYIEMTGDSNLVYFFDPEVNKEAGRRYLLWLERTLHDTHPQWSEFSEEEKKREIIKTYNWGIGKYEKNEWGTKNIPEETSNHILKFEERGAFN